VSAGPRLAQSPVCFAGLFLALNRKCSEHVTLKKIKLRAINMDATDRPTDRPTDRRSGNTNSSAPAGSPVTVDAIQSLFDKDI
jgi:hypothetical protein